MPSLRCPVCRADNGQGPACRRCKADLSLLLALEDHRQALLAEARQHAAVGRWRTFLSAVEQAHALHADDQTRRLRAAGLLLVGDREAALLQALTTQETSA